MASDSFDDEDSLPDAQPPENALLQGKLEDVKSFLDALTCIYSPQHKGQDVTITIHSDGGLRFTVQHAGCLQAAVIVPSSAFNAFHTADTALRLRLNLSLLMESLNLFASGSNPVSATLWHAGPGDPLVLRLWDGAVDTVCALKTLETSDAAAPEVDFGFFQHELICTAMVACEPVRDALSELDYGGATTAELRVSPNAPCFVFASPAATVATELDGTGEDPLCTVELPDPSNRNDETFQNFSCARAQTGVYKLDHLLRCRNALAAGESCKVQMNAYGMLSIMCRMTGNADVDRSRGSGMDKCFVEFVVVAQEIDDDEEGEEDRDEDEDEPPQEVTPNRRRTSSRRWVSEEEDEDNYDDDEEVGPTQPPV